MFIGRHLSADGMELVAITVWSDVESLISVIGEGWESPKWLAGLEDLVTHSSVEHWETAVEDFEPFLPAASSLGVAPEG
jgi:quinol-cytochrome oxidoreductase complex cytochrome b subunit